MECGGQYAKPVPGKDYVTLYGNGDYCSTSYNFEGTNKKYRMVVKGASDNSSTAKVSVYIGGKKVGTVGFTGTTVSEQSLEFKMTDVTGKQEIKFLLETDDGSNNTCVYGYELYYIGDVKPLPDAPTPASVGAVSTGKYRNLFKELGYSDAEIDKKVESAWQKFFYGTDEERIYYPVGDDMAYIYTADTDDVRSEGMSYGMMICVQMDKQEEFNRLWKWAKTYMQHTSGEFKGYFAWQMNTNGTKKDNTPAADGEEYFATSLLFASARWGNGEGIYNYNKEAQEILTTMLHQADDGVGVNMFNREHKMPVFCPIGNAATFSDPSYHLPAFYEVWAREAEQDKDFWSEAAEASRQHFKDATNEKTGLGPDYSEYSGAAKNEGNHGDFRFDAWRIAANIACDYAWWAQDDWATTHANRIQSFFYDQGVDSYGNQWSLDGKNLGADHSPGLVAMNATASLASSDKKSWSFLEDLWNISPTTGKYRYYDGCLYMMGLLHCSGKFRAYLSGNTPVVGVVNGKISTTTAEFDLSADKKEDVTTKLILNDVRTLSEIRNDKTVLEEGKDYTISGDTVSIRKEYLSKQAVGVTKLTFVFDAGKNAVMSITIKDSKLPDVPDRPCVFYINPLHYRKHCFGYAIISFFNNRFYAAEDFYQSFVINICTVLENIYIQNQIEQLSNDKIRLIRRDSVTHMYNPYGFHEMATQMLHDATAAGINCVFFYVRLENLQEITEIYGKKESNEILLCMKSVFEKFEQEKHVLGRLGGSDFCLLLEDKMQEEIEVLAQNFVNEVNEVNISWNKEFFIEVRYGWFVKEVGTISSTDECIRSAKMKMKVGAQMQTSAAKYAFEAMKEIRQNYQKEISVTYMAEQIGISRTHLSHCFKLIYQKSIQDYITSYRMEKAQELLIHTQKKIKEIAFLVGYKDELYFSKVFARLYGMSPSKFRKTMLT